MTMLTAQQAAKELTLSPQTLANWRVQGKGPEFHKLGRRVAYSVDDIDAWRQKNKQTNSQQS